MTREPVMACVALGANLGDAMATVHGALQALGQIPGTSLVQASSLYRTAPHEAQGPDFINAVAVVSTRLTAPDLLRQLQQLENSAGRERPYLNAPRTLDLDLLFYGDARIESLALTVPHPRWGERAFVLVPLAEVAPQRVLPGMLEAVAGQGVARVGS